MRKNIVVSELTGKEYATQDVVRIINVAQIAAYLINGVELLDLYPSRDFETNRPILVALFNRKESAWAYDLWCKHKLD